MNAVLLDGDLQSTLAATRSLGKQGIKVICGADRKTALCFYSKYCNKKFIYTSPIKDKSVFLKDILRFVKTLSEKPVLFTFSDKTFLPIAREYNQFKPYLKIILPEDNIIETVFNKKEVLELATELDISIPKTYFIDNFSQLRELAAQWTYPMVVKPRHSCVWVGNQGIRGRTQYTVSQDDILTKCEAVYSESKEFPLIQEYVPGKEYGIFVLYDGSDIKALSAHKRIRSISPHGGASSLRESISLPEDMKSDALKLIKKVNWKGVAMVEFKRDERDGKPKLMEINGRFWGSLPLTIYSGIDLPVLLFKNTHNKHIEKKLDYKTGIQSRHFLADAKHFLTVLSGKDRINGLPYPKRLSTAFDFLNIFKKNLHYDVISRDDPKPFFAEIIDSIKHKL